ncbi:MAG: hypothetical protein LW817_06380 [Candidatus Caenarcaniphilales bacterium]|jgi:phosphoribosylformylglycinamidine (FGAM) synthase PurS component|nr:hypothetical protein [Candidatus Caenarcaniphilales bacterium]
MIFFIFLLVLICQPAIALSSALSPKPVDQVTGTRYPRNFKFNIKEIQSVKHKHVCDDFTTSDTYGFTIRFIQNHQSNQNFLKQLIADYPLMTTQKAYDANYSFAEDEIEMGLDKTYTINADFKTKLDCNQANNLYQKLLAQTNIELVEVDVPAKNASLGFKSLI